MKILIVYYFFPQFSFRNLHLGKYIVTVDGINIYVACVSWHFPLVLIWLFLWWFRVLAMFSTKLHLFWFSFVPSRAPICAKLRPNRSNSTLFSATGHKLVVSSDELFLKKEHNPFCQDYSG